MRLGTLLCRWAASAGLVFNPFTLYFARKEIMDELQKRAEEQEMRWRMWEAEKLSEININSHDISNFA